MCSGIAIDDTLELRYADNVFKVYSIKSNRVNWISRFELPDFKLVTSEANAIDMGIIMYCAAAYISRTSYGKGIDGVKLNNYISRVIKDNTGFEVEISDSLLLDRFKVSQGLGVTPSKCGIFFELADTDYALTARVRVDEVSIHLQVDDNWCASFALPFLANLSGDDAANAVVTVLSVLLHLSSVDESSEGFTADDLIEPPTEFGQDYPRFFNLVFVRDFISKNVR